MCDVNRILLGISLACAIVYLVGGAALGPAVQVLTKGLTVSLLAVIAFRARQPLLGTALAFGSLGDVLLDLDPAHLFVFGLGAFLAGHVLYTLLFLRHRQRGSRWTPVRVTTAVALVVFVAAFSRWLAPSLGSFAVPVYAYMGAITAMALSSIAMGLPQPWVVAGALLFVASDSMLGAAKFHGPFPGRDFLVWITYCGAQYGICFGYLRSRSAR